MSHKHIAINPELLTWARERAGLDQFDLTHRFPKLPEWEWGEAQPTLKQLEDFAHAVHVPIGYLFLPQPVQESLPIPDFRTLADRVVTRPSPNLLDTLYLCQQRQEWYRDHARRHALPALEFIGSARVGDEPAAVADAMRATLRRPRPALHDALRNAAPRAGTFCLGGK